MKTKGLTLKEAVQSGRNFKRHNHRYYIKNHDNVLVCGPNNTPFNPTLADILAEDFELEQPEPRTEKRWLYRYISEGLKRPFLSDIYFKSDEDFKDYHYRATWFERIEESGFEFPVLTE